MKVLIRAQRSFRESRPFIAMDQALRQRLIGVWLGVAAVLVASFLPWGTFTVTPSIKIDGVPQEAFPAQLFGDMTTTVTMTGWTGTMTLLGVAMPMWFTLVLAFAAAGIATLGATGLWNPPRLLAVVLAGLGLAQVLGILAVLLSAPKATLGGGTLVAIVSFIGLIRACSQLMPREPKRI